MKVTLTGAASFRIAGKILTKNVATDVKDEDFEKLSENAKKLFVVAKGKTAAGKEKEPEQPAAGAGGK